MRLLTIDLDRMFTEIEILRVLLVEKRLSRSDMCSDSLLSRGVVSIFIGRLFLG